jgi:hypothetical protein
MSDWRARRLLAAPGEGKRSDIARPVRRPGLDVAIATESARSSAASVVRVRVHGARGPFRLYLYIDGELAEAWIPGDENNEFSCASLDSGHHTVTARAIDALGRWGGASVVLRAS